MTEPKIDYSVVIPTIGRANLAKLVAAVDQTPAPARIVIADDRPDPASPLKLPATSAPLVVVRSYGHGPAAARNAGWRGTESEWVAFLDDDVTIPADWCTRLVRDLAWSCPPCRRFPGQIARDLCRPASDPPTSSGGRPVWWAPSGSPPTWLTGAPPCW